MNEHPILFNTEMVQAILAGRKTQTRRIINPQPRIQKKCRQTDLYIWIWEKGGSTTIAKKCALHHHLIERHSVKVGDLFWVRETWKPHCPEQKTAFYKADGSEMNGGSGKWKPSIYMPRWACRLELKVTGIRAEQLQDISEFDVVAEGIKLPPEFVGIDMQGNPIEGPECDPCGLFFDLWDSINNKRGYGRDADPWVWVYDFEMIGGEG